MKRQVWSKIFLLFFPFWGMCFPPWWRAMGERQSGCSVWCVMCGAETRPVFWVCSVGFFLHSSHGSGVVPGQFQCHTAPWSCSQVKHICHPFLNVVTEILWVSYRRILKCFLKFFLWLGEFEISCHICSLGLVSLLCAIGVMFFSVEFGGPSFYFFLHILFLLSPSLSEVFVLPGSQLRDLHSCQGLGHLHFLPFLGWNQKLVFKEAKTIKEHKNK